MADGERSLVYRLQENIPIRTILFLAFLWGGLWLAEHLTSAGVVTSVSGGILAGLFSLQHRGIRRVAYIFAPIVLLWLFYISCIGVYNLVVYNPQGIWATFNPMHMYKFLKLAEKDGWVSLGGVVLCITGTEAMFADLGHFNQRSIQIAFATIVYMSLVFGYIGQATYFTKN